MNTLIEEIRKRIKARRTDGEDAYETGQNVAYSDVLQIIDEVEKEHPIPEDVREAANQYIGYPHEVDEGVSTSMRRDAYADGMLDERERMMKGAVEIDTDITINRYTKQHILHISSTDEHIQHLPKGEYKAIIIKKEK